MPYSFSFSTALSGLRAQSSALGVIGNNIANSNTTAFKSGSMSFSDQFYDSLGLRFNAAGNPVQVGTGVGIAGVSTDYSQGTLKPSTSPVHMGIQGNGFFVVKDTQGVQNYTRAGDFSLSREGYLVTPNGFQVQGYNATNGVVPDNAPLEALKIPIGQTLEPNMTTEVTQKFNLNSADPVGTEFTASVVVYDSLGASHTLNLVYTKTSDLNYSVAGDLDGTPVTSVTPAALTFDSDGNLTAPAAPGGLDVVPDASTLNGATLPNIAVNLYEADGTANVSNYAAESGVSSSNQDGYSAGTIAGLSVDPTGIVIAVFNNGQTRPAGQVALAVFNSEDGLSRQGGNQLGETISSGAASIGRPGTGGRGGVVGGALEESNVDLATEFTNLIVAQRGFQANSRVVTTLNQTLQDLLQII